jgi:hypothetical protein
MTAELDWTYDPAGFERRWRLGTAARAHKAFALILFATSATGATTTTMPWPKSAPRPR